MRLRAVVAAVAVTGLMGCGSNMAAPGPAARPSSSSTTAGSPGTGETTPPTSARPTPAAEATLAPYFSAAEEVDARLREAAGRVNQEIGTPRQFSQATLAAIAAANPDPVGRMIPTGMPPALLQAVLSVQGDLVSRYWAFRGAQLPRAEQPEGYLLRCLGHGAQPAARFGSDLRAAQTLARATSPFAVATPDSRAAAEVAIYLGLLTGMNSGCMSCGGGELTYLPPIIWQRDEQGPGGPTDGTVGVGGVRFRAQFQVGEGWVVAFMAC